jgi:betaine reductase
MTRIRVAHYLNQFFAGVGGEGQAGVGPGLREAAVGPGLALQKALGDVADVVGTVYCGDDYIARDPAAAAREVTERLASLRPHVLVAGPAFAAGRYGVACAYVSAAARQALGIPSVTGMHPGNPGADLARGQAYVVATGELASGMASALSRMAHLAVKLARGEALGSAAAEGYLPTGLRKNELAELTAAERAVEMLLAKVSGRPFVTETPLPAYDVVSPAAPSTGMSGGVLALVTEGGCVPAGNPDRLEAAWATKWLKYDIAGRGELTPRDFECCHGGFDTTRINEDPHRLIPLDAVRALQAQGRLGGVASFLYSTVGNWGPIPTMRRFGQEMAEDLLAQGVTGVMLVAT